MNVVLELGNPSMRPRHWEKLFKILNQSWYLTRPNTPHPSLTTTYSLTLAVGFL